MTAASSFGAMACYPSFDEQRRRAGIAGTVESKKRV